MHVKIYEESGGIVLELPLTKPTGKVRVKRRTKNFGVPVATRREELLEKDYVEWQISYATEEASETAVESIRLSDGRIGFELAKILCEAKRLGILREKDFNEMKEFAKSVRDKTIEEKEEIVRIRVGEEVAGGFVRFEEKVPVFVKEADKYFIEIVLRHKQKAVGFQSMVYLCIWLKNMENSEGNPPIGRPARSREHVKFKITDGNIIKDVVKAFAIASRKHNQDISEIVEQVLEKC